ncbi:hypothetical protein Tco_0703165 [Tanacetum coccineum]|uniref:Uncharacterized protein n=1 Tax=Tanacetum coccineum TaxID=301880 RepID=A0ABQ4XY17_9ASTR
MQHSKKGGAASFDKGVLEIRSRDNTIVGQGSLGQIYTRRGHDYRLGVTRSIIEETSIRNIRVHDERSHRGIVQGDTTALATTWRHQEQSARG